jgi:hypothetical protein
MGLLDDAIREHLELKRLRGADPGEIARLEREALGPVRRGVEAAAPAEPNGGAEPLELGDAAEQGQERIAEPAPADREPRAETAAEADVSSAQQETAELDMSTVVDDDEHGMPASTAAAEGELRPRPDEPRPAGPGIEEEQPTPARDEPEHARGAGHEEAPERRGQVAFPDEPGEEEEEEEEASAEQPVEDVLEETPDFLQETPEHDRLWFEQRPPRDFDFDK